MSVEEGGFLHLNGYIKPLDTPPPPSHGCLPEGLGGQYTEAGLLKHLPDLVPAPRHGVGLHLLGSLVVGGELHVTGEIRDGETVPLPLLNLGDVWTSILLFLNKPAEKLLEDWGGEGGREEGKGGGEQKEREEEWG